MSVKKYRIEKHDRFSDTHSIFVMKYVKLMKGIYTGRISYFYMGKYRRCDKVIINSLDDIIDLTLNVNTNVKIYEKLGISLYTNSEGVETLSTYNDR